MSRSRLAGACALLLCVLGCAQAYERGERLYSQGDVPGALAVWRGIPESSREYARAHARLETIEAELAATLARYEKRAEFFEGEGRLAEAVLYYRLALKLDPDRPATLERVQSLFRAQHEQEATERERLSRALAAGNLREANASADKLSRINPFDPGIQIEVRQVYAETGAQVLRSLEDGKRAYANGDRAGAAAAFQRALELDPENEAALGYLSYIRRYDQEVTEEDQRKRSAAERSATAALRAPPPPTPSSQEILAEGHYRAGQQAEEQGDPYRAIEEYMAALEVDDKHAGAHRRLTALRQELQPRLPALYEQGKHYFQTEDLEKALSVWRNALLIAPDDQRTKENVDRAERILSRLEEIQTRGP
ncbi:MAG TPA: tetratricopeptide repeat protein [Myxococcota bacterium]|nr:tetratricopeptide repeat protein [Myxococcota bacterium]